MVGLNTAKASVTKMEKSKKIGYMLNDFIRQGVYMDTHDNLNYIEKATKENLSDFYDMELVGLGTDQEIREQCVEGAAIQNVAVY